MINFFNTANAQVSSSLEAGIEELAADISNQMKAKGISKIAIDDFTDLNGYKSAVGDFISEELVTNFYTQGIGSFEVVERRELARVLKEQKLGSSGLLNKATIAKVGEILGIDAIVTGSIAYLGRHLKVNARMLGVNDAKVFAAASKKIPKDDSVIALLSQTGRTNDSTSVSSAQVHSFQTKYENTFLIARPISVYKLSDNKGYTVTFEIENKLSEEIMLVSIGNEATLSGNKGFTEDIYGIPGIENNSTTWLNQNGKRGTLISPKGKTSFIAKFRAPKPTTDTKVNLSIAMARNYGTDEWDYRLFTLALNRMEVQ